MLYLIGSNPIFEKWLDGASLRSKPRSEKLRPAKTAADWFAPPEHGATELSVDESDTANQCEP